MTYDGSKAVSILTMSTTVYSDGTYAPSEISNWINLHLDTHDSDHYQIGGAVVAEKVPERKDGEILNMLKDMLTGDTSMNDVCQIAEFMGYYPKFTIHADVKSVLQFDGEIFAPDTIERVEQSIVDEVRESFSEAHPENVLANMNTITAVGDVSLSRKETVVVEVRGSRNPGEFTTTEWCVDVVEDEFTESTVPPGMYSYRESYVDAELKSWDVEWVKA